MHVRRVTARLVSESILREELWPRGCHLQPYQRRDVPVFALRGPFIAYCSPDSTWHVTREVLGAARESILVGMYDFEAEYVRDALEQARTRGVHVTLMLDCDCLKGEADIFDELAALGCECVPARHAQVLQVISLARRTRR
jgi:phosphatidylserine/phosphatidylglycerophosphate/cardiolipin synthase-like enzyme